MGNKQKEKRLGWAGSCFAVVVITVVVVVVVVALRSSPIDKVKVGKEKKKLDIFCHGDLLLHSKGFAATAHTLCVRIVKYKLGGELVFDVIHFRSQDCNQCF